MISLEVRKFNLIAAIQLAEFSRDRNHMERFDGNARVLIASCYLDYVDAGGEKYIVTDGPGDARLVVLNPDAEN